MYFSDHTIKKYHIPSIDTIMWNNINISYNWGNIRSIIVPNQSILSWLLKINKWDIELDSVPFFQKLYPWDWIADSWELNLLYISPFHPNIVRKGDLVVLIFANNTHLICQYLWWGDYLTKIKGKQPLIVKVNILRSFNVPIAIIKDTSLDFTRSFQSFYNDILVDKKLQLHTNRWTEDYPFVWTQRLYDTFIKEIKSIYDDFWSDAKNIVLWLNERKIIKSNWEYTLHQNRNSRSFYRDANYSLSWVKWNPEHNDCEVAIVSFYPKHNKTIEIVQIWWNASFEQEDFVFLWTDIINYMKEYFLKLWFEEIIILRWDKNINFIHPKQSSLRSNFDLKKHQETMLLRYNATPSRKRWFSKPDDRYSHYKLR